MKKILLITGALLMLGATSCKKCQTCTTNVSQDIGGTNVSVSADSQEYCGDQYDDAPAESAVNQNIGGVSQTVAITCTDS
jgi:hypothetical protein